jgi:uncharacterized protein YndB with AHSA1/START domain
MTNETTTPVRTPIKFERRYDASVEDLWDLWTTKDGFESWWGPERFRVEVHAINPTVGGELSYEMIAVGVEEIGYMKKMGMAVSHGTRGTFVEVEPHNRLKIRHTIDFIPGLRPYDNDILVEFTSEGSGVRMLVTVDQHPDEEWTRRAAAGFESQLTKLLKALAARRK